MKRAMAAIGTSTLLAAGGASPAVAQPLADPMRPPAIGVPAAPGAGPSGPRVQTILIRPDRRHAVVDGHGVAVGGRVGDARVVQITETEVTLRDDEGAMTVLKLLPQAEKKMTDPAKRAAKGGRTP